MKKMLLFIVLSIFFCTTYTFAHESKESGSIEALFYAEPHGEIIQGVPATLHVEFQNVPEDFDLLEGELALQILDDGKVLTEKKLQDTDVIKSKNTFQFTFTFPHDGMYVLKVFGSVGKTELSYSFETIYVGMGEGFWHHVQYHLAHIVIFGLGIIAGGILAFWKPKKRLS